MNACTEHCGHCGRCETDERREALDIQTCGVCGDTVTILGHSIAGLGVFCSASCVDAAVNERAPRDYFVGFSKGAA